MADIDKSLPNEIRTEVEIPAEEEVVEEIGRASCRERV